MTQLSELNEIHLESNAFSKGKIDKKMNKPIYANPYNKGSSNYWEWIRGYFSSQSEN